MNNETYIAADMRLVEFDVVDVIATSVEDSTLPTILPTETEPQMPSLGPNDTEIL